MDAATMLRPSGYAWQAINVINDDMIPDDRNLLIEACPA